MDDRHAEVEVVRVLKGAYEPGQRVRMEVWAAANQRGELLVLSDAEVLLAPSFNELPLDYESEVRWLVDRSPVRTVGGAILRAQGASDESRAAGTSFLARARPFPVGRLLEAVEAAGLVGEAKGYERGCLLDGLTLVAHPAGATWLRRAVDRWLEGTSKATDWADPDRWPTERCRELTALVGTCGEHWSPAFFTAGRPRPPEVLALQRELVGRLLARLPTLDVTTQADVTFALVVTRAAAPEVVLARLPVDGDRDGFALGMLRVGHDHARVWAWEEAQAAWTTARRVARRVGLAASLEEELHVER